MRSGRVSARYEAGSQIVQAGLTYVVMGCAESLPTCGFSETERLGRRCALFTMFNGFRLLLFLVKAKRDEYPAFACGCDLRHEYAARARSCNLLELAAHSAARTMLNEPGQSSDLDTFRRKSRVIWFALLEASEVRCWRARWQY